MILAYATGAVSVSLTNFEVDGSWPSGRWPLQSVLLPIEIFNERSVIGDIPDVVDHPAATLLRHVYGVEHIGNVAAFRILEIHIDVAHLAFHCDLPVGDISPIALAVQITRFIERAEGKSVAEVWFVGRILSQIFFFAIEFL